MKVQFLPVLQFPHNIYEIGNPFKMGMNCFSCRIVVGNFFFFPNLFGLLIGLVGRIGAYQNQILMHDIPWVVGHCDFHDQFSEKPLSLHDISIKIYGLLLVVTGWTVSSPWARSQISSRLGHWSRAASPLPSPVPCGPLAKMCASAGTPALTSAS
jgi:hypothetical protein